MSQGFSLNAFRENNKIKIWAPKSSVTSVPETKVTPGSKEELVTTLNVSGSSMEEVFTDYILKNPAKAGEEYTWASVPDSSQSGVEPKIDIYKKIPERVETSVTHTYTSSEEYNELIYEGYVSNNLQINMDISTVDLFRSISEGATGNIMGALTGVLQGMGHQPIVAMDLRQGAMFKSSNYMSFTINTYIIIDEEMTIERAEDKLKDLMAYYLPTRSEGKNVQNLIDKVGASIINTEKNRSLTSGKQSTLSTKAL